MVDSRAREGEQTASWKPAAAALEALSAFSKALGEAATARAAADISYLVAVSACARSRTLFTEATPKASGATKGRSAETTEARP